MTSTSEWKRNLLIVWIVQFFGACGFSLSMPFTPFYLADLGVNGDAELKFWVSLFGASTPLTLAIFGPIWGNIGDRHGFKLMMMRATAGAVLVLGLMGVVRSPAQLIALRLLQGMLTGTVTAAQAMVASCTPGRHTGVALGILSSAVYIGTMAGSAFGGVLGDMFGYRNTFFCSSGMALISLLLIFFLHEDRITRPAPGQGREPRPGIRSAFVPGVLSLLTLVAFMAGIRQFDAPWIPLLVREIHGSVHGAASITGALAASSCVAGVIAGVALGRMSDRISPPAIGRLSALGSGLLMIPQGLARGFILLFAARFGMTFCAAGLDPVFQVWLTKVTPPSKRGVIFGWATTAKSVGWIFAPLVSGTVASVFGVRAVYFAGAALFLALIPAITRTVRRIAAERAAGAAGR